MKGIIIYKSKYGSTKKYAEWLKEATGFEMVEADKAKIDEVAQCDTIIFGGGIYAGGIAGVNFLKKNIAKLDESSCKPASATLDDVIAVLS